jgi:hypothetical protein
MYIRIVGATKHRKETEISELSKSMLESICSLMLDQASLYTYLSSCLAWVIDSGRANCALNPQFQATLCACPSLVFMPYFREFPCTCMPSLLQDHEDLIVSSRKCSGAQQYLCRFFYSHSKELGLTLSCSFAVGFLDAIAFKLHNLAPKQIEVM